MYAIRSYYGLINGVVIGVLVAIIAYVWKDIPILGLVVGGASFLNLICASIAGFFVPVGIEKLKIDPALASPILVTTITDSLGVITSYSIHYTKLYEKPAPALPERVTNPDPRTLALAILAILEDAQMAGAPLGIEFQPAAE